MSANHTGSFADDELGRRLASARASAGLSQEAVAREIGIPRTAVSHIETGQRSVSGLELARLALLYGMRIDDLFGSASLTPTGTAAGEPLRFFRAAGALADETERWLVEADEKWRHYAGLELLVHGGQRYELPSYPVPLGRPYQQGERLAQQERRRLNLGAAPIRSVLALLEDEGVKVLLLRLGPRAEISGGYFFSEELGPCVVINEDELPSRRRFTAAHEYCHFLVDREEVEGEICAQGKRHEPFEQRANTFAAAFLLPADGVLDTLEDMGVVRGAVRADEVVHLMYRFGVSYEAVTWRLLNLGWIDVAHREELAAVSSTEVARRLGYDEGMRPGETEPKPSRFRKLALDAWREGKLAPEELAGLLGVPQSELASVFGAPSKAPTARRKRTHDADWF